MLTSTSLVPRPHLQGGNSERVWWTWAKSLGLRWGISTHQSDHSSGTVIWLAYRRNVTSLYLLYKPNRTRNSGDQSDPSFAQPPIACASIRTNQIQALHGLVGARHRTRTEDSAQVHQTHFLAKGRVWERDYTNTQWTATGPPWLFVSTSSFEDMVSEKETGNQGFNKSRL